MFEHIVVFRFKDSLSKEKQRDLLNTLMAFKQQIPSIISLSAGINETEEVQNVYNYTLGLRITFQSKEALQNYLPHPVHQAFVHKLDGLLENVVVMDYPLMNP